MASDVKRVDIDMKELETILDRARDGTLDEEGYKKLKAALETLGYLTDLIGDKDTTIRRLRNIIFGSSTEKSSSAIGESAGRSGKSEGIRGRQCSRTRGQKAQRTRPQWRF